MQTPMIREKQEGKSPSSPREVFNHNRNQMLVFSSWSEGHTRGNVSPLRARDEPRSVTHQTPGRRLSCRLVESTFHSAPAGQTAEQREDRTNAARPSWHCACADLEAAAGGPWAVMVMGNKPKPKPLEPGRAAWELVGVCWSHSWAWRLEVHLKGHPPRFERAPKTPLPETKKFTERNFQRARARSNTG